MEKATAASPRLTVDSVSFAYENGRRALKDCSLEIQPGQLIGIIGPNGSGKSTLLRLMAGILKPQAGSVTLDGQPLDRMRRDAIARRISFLPQIVQPAFAYTCEEIVAQGRFPHLGAFGFLTPRDLQVVRQCMEWTDTLEFAERPLDECSGGERQRVLLASVLAQGADYLLLDEPTTALDVHHQAEVFLQLKKFAHSGLAVVVVVHDLNLAAQFCERLLLLSVGRIVSEGSAGEVLSQQRLHAVYGGNIAVAQHPLTGDPLVTALTAKTNPEPGGEKI